MTTGLFDHPLLGGVFGDAEIAALFSVEAELRAMVAVEIALAQVQGAQGIIPADAARAIADRLAGFTPDPAELTDSARANGIIVPGLVTSLRAEVGAPHGPYVHWGATTQDIMDTGLILRLRDALGMMAARLDTLIALLAEGARQHAALPMAARTRSQVATPTTFGLRLAGWLAPLMRCRDRLAELSPRLFVVQCGGAAGTLGVFGERGVAVMEGLAAELDLAAPAKPWHSERDTIVELAHWLALVTGVLGKMAGDVILMGRSESRELRAGQGGGSSTMPHKANPVAAEAIVTIARHNAGQVGAVHQAMLHAEERDGAAWALEWMVLPQMVVSTGAALAHGVTLAGDLQPDAARMAAMLGDDTMAEAAAFALAAHMPLGEAQALVKRAMLEDGPLQERLAVLTDGLSSQADLGDPASTLVAAVELVARVLTGADDFRILSDDDLE